MKELDKNNLLEEARKEIKTYSLKEIKKGIFSFGDFEYKKLAIAVHPFFACEYEVDEEINFPLNYNENIEKFLLNYNGTIITLEDIENLGKTLNKLTRQAIKSNRVIIPTPEHYPDPLCSWKEFMDFVQLFEEEPKIIGGYLHHSYSTPGCLGRTAQIFEMFGINFSFNFDLIYPKFPNGYEAEIKKELFERMDRIKLEERILKL